MTSLIQHFEANFMWKVSLKILNSGIILKTFTHDFMTRFLAYTDTLTDLIIDVKVF